MPAKGTRSTGGSASKTPTTPSDSARIQSTQAKAGNDTGKNSFPARTQTAAAKNVATGAVPKATKGSK